MLIGTNDLGVIAFREAPSAELEAQLMGAAGDVARRIQGAVRQLCRRLPQAQVVLLGLLPRGTGSGEGVPVGQGDFSYPSVFTPAITKINGRLQTWAAGQRGVTYLDCGARFLLNNGTQISSELMPDAIHPGAEGHEELARCLQPVVTPLMR